MTRRKPNLPAGFFVGTDMRLGAAMLKILGLQGGRYRIPPLATVGWPLR